MVGPARAGLDNDQDAARGAAGSGYPFRKKKSSGKKK